MQRNVQLSRPAVYTIKVQGRLDAGWSDWFDNLDITVADSRAGMPVTTLCGRVADQAALHSLLTRIRDLGLPLLLVQHADFGGLPESRSAGEER